MISIYDLYDLDDTRRRKGLEPLVIRNTSYINLIEKYLYLKFGDNYGLEIILRSNGMRRWRMYALNHLATLNLSNKVLNDKIEALLWYPIYIYSPRNPKTGYVGRTIAERIETKWITFDSDEYAEEHEAIVAGRMDNRLLSTHQELETLKQIEKRAHRRSGNKR